MSYRSASRQNATTARQGQATCSDTTEAKAVGEAVDDEQRPYPMVGRGFFDHLWMEFYACFKI